MKSQRQHIIVRKKQSGIAFLFLDSPGKHNFLNRAVLDELAESLTVVEQDPEVAALVIISGKADSFIVGASLQEISQYTTKDEALELVNLGHQVFSQIENFDKPVVAAINGACLGGGLELALSCHRRIGTDATMTNYALPEVTHGLIPGWGGTQRLPKTIGVERAIEMIVSGQMISAITASEVGLIDKLVSPDNLLPQAENFARTLVDIPHDELVRSANHSSPQKLEKIFALWKRATRLRTRGNYPAALKALEAIKTGLISGFAAGASAEKEMFADLAIDECSKNMISLFFTKELAKQQADKISAEYNKSSVCLIAAPIELTLLCEVLASPAASLEDAELIVDFSGVQNNEQPFDWNQHLKALNKLVKPNAVLAIVLETSLLSEIDEFSAGSATNRIIGLKLMHPLNQMPLAELVTNDATTKQAIGVTSNFIRRLKKLPLVVPDSPGTVVDRITTAYLLQSARLAASGIPTNHLEKAAIEFGMPIGPLAVTDEIGLRRCKAIASNLKDSFGDRFHLPSCIDAMIASGLEGRSSGNGIYHWDGNKRVELNPILETIADFKSSDEIPSNEELQLLARKMILPMVDEAARCLNEKIVRRPRDIDLALALGIGFPAFRGGLLKYADKIGSEQIVQELDEIYQETAPARRVSDYLRELMSNKRGFYSKAVER